MTSRRPALTLAASAVAWHGRGVLVRGASGAGKSSLVLQILARGGLLVADDLVGLDRAGLRLVARHWREPGLIEARGLGIFRIAAGGRAGVSLLVELTPEARMERLPEPGSESFLGVTVPCVAIDAAAPAAADRVLLALTSARTA